MNQTSTSAPQPPTVVPNLILPDGAGSNPSTSVGAKPPLVANLVVAPPQTTMTTEVVANLGTTASNTRPIPTVDSSAPAYIPPARRYYVDPRPIHGPNLNVNRSQSDGIQRTSATGVSMATVGNPISALNPHVTMNTQIKDNHNQVASVQRNIMQHYSTELELHQVMELSAVDKEIRRLQMKRTAMAVGNGDQFTSTPNPNLSGPQSVTLNPFVQPFASTLPFPALRPWTMPGYVASPHIPLFGVPGGHLMAGAGTQMGIQNTMTPTSVSQSKVQLPPGDGSHSSGRRSGSAGPSQNPPDPDPEPDPEKTKRDKAIDAKQIGRFLIYSESLRAAKGRLRGNMKCEVERYERGTDLTIEDWINQMETYFTVGQVPPEAFVGFMLMKIVQKHLNEIKEYQNLDYLAFRENLLEVFEEPDMATAYLNALATVAQDREETISEYMHRVRLLVLKAHLNLEHSARERILVTSFMLGLHNKQLAASLAVVKVQTAAEAERLAAEGEAVRRDQKSRKSSGNYLLSSASREPESE